MSERKTAEIKFRCTPTFKASLQAAADTAGVSMSEYIETAVWSHQKSEYSETAVWSHQNQQLDGAALINTAIAAQIVQDAALHPESEQALALEGAVPPVDEYTVESVEIVESRSGVGVSLSNLTCDRACKPWEFCRCKASA